MLTLFAHLVITEIKWSIHIIFHHYFAFYTLWNRKITKAELFSGVDDKYLRHQSSNFDEDIVWLPAARVTPQKVIDCYLVNMTLSGYI